ncbi:MAG: hypothetical protein EHM48_05585, partial [Planctomycetaceae bacterium]
MAAKMKTDRRNRSCVCEMLEPRLFLSTTMFREGGGTGYIDTTFDDAEIVSATDTVNGSSTSGIMVGGTKYGLLGVNDLFSLLPKNSGGQLITVSQAKLHLFRYNTGTSGNTISVFRATSDWMTDAAGVSENDVTFQHRDKSTDLHWAGGNFSSSDYDSANGVSTSFVSSYNEEVIIDITSLMQSMYQNEVNNGFVIYASASSNFRTSESGITLRPVLEVTYTYIGATVSISATDASAAEPSNTGTYTVTRDGSTSGALTVNYTVSGTATNGTDYTALSGTVTIPDGQASTTITLSPINDNTVESTETVILTLASGSGYTIG